MIGTATTDALVGRAELLARTQAWIDDARQGRGRCVLLTGEAGIGKTRAAQEMLERARTAGMATAVGRCHPDPGAPPYWPWVQIVRDLLRGGEADVIRRALGPDLARIAEILPELHASAADLAPLPVLEATAARFHLLDATMRLVLDAARRQPLALLVDDLHWADRGALEALAMLAPATGDAPLLVLATARTGADAGASSEEMLPRLERLGMRIPLSGIGPDDVARLLEIAAGAPAPAAAAAALHRRTAGNPLFVHELLRLLAATHDLTRLEAADVEALPLPTGVRHVIEERLRALGGDVRAVLETAAVVGKEFDLATLRAVATASTELPSATALLTAIEHAAGGGLVAARGEVVGAYAFTHDVVRETLVETLAPARRAVLHGRIGTARAAGGAAVEDVAEHFVAAAGIGYADEAVTWATRAGTRALGQWAYDAAVRHFEHALAALEMTTGGERRRCDLRLALGDALARAGDTSRATTVLRAAAADARTLGSPDHLARAALLLPQGRGEFTTSPHLFDPDTAALLEEARAALGDRESTLRARVLAALSASPDRAALAADAVALARRLDDPATLGYALHRWLLTLGPLRAPERLALADEILTHAARANDKLLEFEGQTERLMALLEHGDRAAVDDAVARHARLVHELRQPGPRWTNAVVRALQAFLDGALEESERRAGEAFAIGREAQPATAEQAFAGQMAVIRAEQDRLAEVVPAVAALAADQPDVPAWRCALAYMYAEIDRPTEARAELDRLAGRGFADLPVDGLLHIALANLAEACVALGAREHADALYACLRPLAGRHLVVGGALCLGAADRHLAGLAALAARPADAARHFAAALAAQSRLGAIPWLAHTRLEYARFLLRHDGPASEIRALLDEVRRTATTFGLARLARRLDAYPLGEAPPAAPARPRPRARLARDGESWAVAWGDRTGRIRDLKGLRYLAYLLTTPGRDVHVLDLLALTEGPVAAGPDGDPDTLDGGARGLYRARLAELRGALDDAEARGEQAGTTHLREEIGGLEEELAAAYGLGAGRRPEAGTARERARKSVTNRVRAAVTRLGAIAPEMRRHLDIALRTGTLCAYRPDREIDWEIVP